MYLLTDFSQIQELIDEFTDLSLLWIDTEVADYETKNPRLSLISILAYPQDLTGERTCILDVLNQPKLVEYFIAKILENSHIEKVFHNAEYDLKFLGKERAKNVTCTLKMAKNIPYHLLPIPYHKLKTLAEYLTPFTEINKTEQTSDWGKRPLSKKQLEYAKLDPVYLCQIHQQLKLLIEKSKSESLKEDLNYLGEKYKELEEKCKLLTSEMEEIKERIKQAMAAQNIKETPILKLSTYERKTVKVDFMELAEKAKVRGLDLHFPVTLTKELQKKTTKILTELNLQEENKQVVQLTIKSDHVPGNSYQ